jgi:hypothetical protein
MRDTLPCLELLIDAREHGDMAFTALAAAPGPVLFAARPLTGSVFMLTDTDAEGLPDTPALIADGLDRPNGLAWYDETLYITAGRGLYTWAADDGLRLVRDDLLLSSADTGAWTGGIAVNAAWLYIAQADGAVWRYPRAQAASAPGERFAHGFAQPADVAVLDAPASGVPDAPESGVPDAPESGVPDAPESGVPDAQESGVPDAQESGVPDAQESGVPDAQESGVPDAQESGVPDAQESGVPDAQESGVFVTDAAASAVFALAADLVPDGGYTVRAGACVTAEGCTVSALPASAWPLGVTAYAYAGDSALAPLAGRVLVAWSGTRATPALDGYAVLAHTRDLRAWEPVIPSVPEADSPLYTDFDLRRINQYGAGFFPERPYDVAVSETGGLYLSVGGRILSIRAIADVFTPPP